MVRGRLGICDSGVGGLTVAARLLEQMPDLSLHYFGDTAHVPYGNRAPEEVVYLVGTIVKHLVECGAAAVVLACNTSTALACESIRSWCPVPLIGIIDPAARAAANATRNGRIGLIGSPLTARSGAYERAASPSVVPLNGAVRHPQVLSVGCPRLVPLIESGQVYAQETREALQEYLAPLQAEEIDTLILGCTHYPFLRPLIQDVLGDGVKLIDPADYVIHELHRLGISGSGGAHRFEVSGSPADFERVGTRLWGQRLSGVSQISLRPAEALAV